jgi:hypothetical protein
VLVTAYAIVQRVPDATPRLRLTRIGNSVDPAANGAPAARLEQAASLRLEADDRESFADRLAALRTALSQTTWYLFNPDGWR